MSIGADSANAYLADGITSELATALARVPGVRVVSRSRAAAMLKSGKSPNEVGKALNVAQQLEGTVQRDGNRLRVTARLVGVSDGVIHWSDMYDRDATDLLAVQDELARAITGAVGAAMGNDIAGASAAAPPVVTGAEGKAYDLYLRGRFQLGRRSGASLRKAVAYCEEAIDKDPSLAAAHSGLADALGLLPLYTDAAAEPALASGDAMAAQRTKARIESIPARPGTDVALARIALALGDTNGALERLERAARTRDPFFSTESATSPVFDALRSSPRYATLLRSVGLTPFRMVAGR